MSYGMITVNIVAAILIVAVLWWFFGGKLPAAKAENSSITIYIKDGVYQPAFIQAAANKPITLHFIREDDSACAATVVFPQLNLAYDLPKNQITEIVLPAQPASTLDFTCRMGMYRGRIVFS